MSESATAQRAAGPARANAPAGEAATDARVSQGAAPASSGPPPRAKPRSSRFLIPLAVFAALVIVLAFGIMNSRTVGVIRSPLIGKHAPAWSLPVLGQPGRTFGSKDLAGKWYVLNVWGSWCFACKDEHGELLEISRSSSVPLIGIDWRDDDADARAFLSNLGNPYETVTTDRDGHVILDWGVYGAPETFLVNPDGIVVFKQTGPLTPEVWKKEFASRLPAALVESRP